MKAANRHKLVTRWRTAPRDDVDVALAVIAEELLAFVPQHLHDKLVLEALWQAMLAADSGNPAVGAILVDRAGSVLQRGHARNLQPHFRSDLHAEMQLLTAFEQRKRFPNLAAVQAVMSGSMLVSSLEPCTMCTARLIMSGVSTVLYAADETGGGQVHALESLPQVWRELIQSNKKVMTRADCSERLREIAWEMFLTTINASGRTDLWPEAQR